MGGVLSLQAGSFCYTKEKTKTLSQMITAKLSRLTSDSTTAVMTSGTYPTVSYERGLDKPEGQSQTLSISFSGRSDTSLRVGEGGLHQKL